eukprot:153835-Hanusia_phi.AAC.2
MVSSSFLFEHHRILRPPPPMEGSAPSSPSSISSSYPMEMVRAAGCHRRRLQLVELDRFEQHEVH